MVDLPDRVRGACAEVAESARYVQVAGDRIDAYAAKLRDVGDVPDLDPVAHYLDGPPAAVIAFMLCLDAINFGSGWWPTIRKRPGHSGYLTIASGLADRFRECGPWTASELRGIQLAEVADVFGQDRDHELMPLFAASLRDLGEHVCHDLGGRYERVLEGTRRSAVSFAERLAGWRCFTDVSRYGDLEVPFFKRAQLACADLQAAGVADFVDMHRLTAFADNLLPHVLRLDGVLILHPSLEARIDHEVLLIHDSPEEIELRAGAVHAIELISAASSHHLSPAEIDMVIWTRGQGPVYKARPRPRSRSTAY